MAGGERDLEGFKDRTSQMSLYSAHTDREKTGMSGPKGRTKGRILEACQESLQLLGTEYGIPVIFLELKTMVPSER